MRRKYFTAKIKSSRAFHFSQAELGYFYGGPAERRIGNGAFFTALRRKWKWCEKILESGISLRQPRRNKRASIHAQHRVTNDLGPILMSSRADLLLRWPTDWLNDRIGAAFWCPRRLSLAKGVTRVTSLPKIQNKTPSSTFLCQTFIQKQILKSESLKRLLPVVTSALNGAIYLQRPNFQSPVGSN